MQERQGECDTLRNCTFAPIDLSCGKKSVQSWPKPENVTSALSCGSSLKEEDPSSEDSSLGLNLVYNKSARGVNNAYIPLSKIKAKLNGEPEDSKGQNLTKRARLEQMVSNIFQNHKSRSPDSSTTLQSDSDRLCDSSDDTSKPQSDATPSSSPKRRRNTSSPFEACPQDLSRKHSEFEIKCEKFDPSRESPIGGVSGSRFLETILSNPSLTKNYLQREQEMFIQRMLQLQLSSAAYLTNSFGNGHPPDQQTLLKSFHQYPPWLYYGYYSQLIQNPWNSEHHSPPSVSCLENEERKESTPSPTLSCGVASRHSDEVVGDANSRRRAPRALTGKHVRQGTGASPSTLLILRQTIQERQKLKKLKSELEINSKLNKKGNKRKCR